MDLCIQVYTDFTKKWVIVATPRAWGTYTTGSDRSWLGGYVGNATLSLRQRVHMLIGGVVYRYARDVRSVKVML
jgi:hypothetical protein